MGRTCRQTVHRSSVSNLGPRSIKATTLPTTLLDYLIAILKFLRLDLIFPVSSLAISINALQRKTKEQLNLYQSWWFTGKVSLLIVYFSDSCKMVFLLFSIIVIHAYCQTYRCSCFLSLNIVTDTIFCQTLDKPTQFTKQRLNQIDSCYFGSGKMLSDRLCLLNFLYMHRQ